MELNSPAEEIILAGFWQHYTVAGLYIMVCQETEVHKEWLELDVYVGAHMFLFLFCFVLHSIYGYIEDSCR